MNFCKCITFFLGIIFLSVSYLYSQDNFDDLFSDLIYDPNEPYLSGSAVVVSLEDGEIYTASQDVPAASDGSNGPNGANASTYWGDSTTTTQKFEMFPLLQMEVMVQMELMHPLTGEIQPPPPKNLKKTTQLF